MAEKSVTIVLEAHNRLSGPFGEAQRSAQALAAELKSSAASAREFAASQQTWSMDELAGGGSKLALSRREMTMFANSLSMAGLHVRGLGTGLSALAGSMGPIGLVVASLGGIVAILKEVSSGWAEQAKAAQKAFADEEKAIREHTDFMAAEARRRAEIAGDETATFELELERRGKAARAEIQARYQAERDALAATAAAMGVREAQIVTVGSGVDTTEQRRAEALAALEANEKAAREQLAQEQEAKAAKTRDEAEAKTRREWQAQQDARDREMHARWDREAREKETAAAEEERKREARRRAGDWWAKSIKDARGKPAAYSPLQAYESMQGLRAPGQDPMLEQVKLSRQILKAVEKTEKNTAPAGSPSWKPEPVY